MWTGWHRGEEVDGGQERNATAVEAALDARVRAVHLIPGAVPLKVGEVALSSE
jgi:hypothetical protein